MSQYEQALLEYANSLKEMQTGDVPLSPMSNNAPQPIVPQQPDMPPQQQTKEQLPAEQPESYQQALSEYAKSVAKNQSLSQQVLPDGKPDPVQDKIGFWENIERGGWKGFFNKATLGVTELADAASLYGSVKRMQEAGYGTDPYGQDMKAADEKKITDYLNKQAEESERGLTVAASVGNIVGEMLPFVAEFIYSGGAASLGKKAVSKGARRMIIKTLGKQAAESVAGRSTAKLAGWATAGAIRTALTPHRSITGYIENRMPDIQFSPEGQLIIKESTNTPFKAAYKAIGNQWVQMASEESGEFLAKAGGNIARKVLPAGATKALDALGEAWVKSKGGRTISDFAKKIGTVTGINSVLGEMSEERLGGLMTASLGLEDDRNDPRTTFEKIGDALYPGAKQLWIEAIAFSVPGMAQVGIAKAMSRKEFEEETGIKKSSAQERLEYQQEKSKVGPTVERDNQARGIPRRPEVSNADTPLQQAESLRRQQEWDKKYPNGIPTEVAGEIQRPTEPSPQAPQAPQEAQTDQTPTELPTTVESVKPAPNSIPERLQALKDEGMRLAELSKTPEGYKKMGEIADRLDEIDKEIENLTDMQEKAIGKDPKYIAKKLGITLNDPKDKKRSIYQLLGAEYYYLAGLEGKTAAEIRQGGETLVQFQAFEDGVNQRRKRRGLKPLPPSQETQASPAVQTPPEATEAKKGNFYAYKPTPEGREPIGTKDRIWINDKTQEEAITIANEKFGDDAVIQSISSKKMTPTGKTTFEQGSPENVVEYTEKDSELSEEDRAFKKAQELADRKGVKTFVYAQYGILRVSERVPRTVDKTEVTTFEPKEKRPPVNTRKIGELNKKIASHPAYKLEQESEGDPLERLPLNANDTIYIAPEEWGDVRDAIDGIPFLQKIFKKGNANTRNMKIDNWATENYMRENETEEESASYQGRIPGRENTSDLSLFIETILAGNEVREGRNGKINENTLSRALRGPVTEESQDLMWLITERDLVRSNVNPEEIAFAKKEFFSKNKGVKINDNRTTEEGTSPDGDEGETNIQNDQGKASQEEIDDFLGYEFTDEEIEAQNKRQTDMLGREELKGGTTGKQQEFVDVEKTKTIKAQEEDISKGDAVGQMDIFGGQKEKAPKMVGPEKKSTGDIKGQASLLDQPPAQQAKPENEFAVFLGVQEGVPEEGIPDFKLYNLKKDIPGHPVNSTVTEETLIEAGIEVPGKAQTNVTTETIKDDYKKRKNLNLGKNVTAAFKMKDGSVIETGVVHILPENVDTKDVSEKGFVINGKFLNRQQTEDYGLSAHSEEIKNQLEFEKKSLTQEVKEKPLTKEVKKKERKLFFTDEAAEAAKKFLTDKNTLFSGVDPRVIKALIDIGGNIFEKGAYKFSDWSKEMVNIVGEKVKPYLKKVWAEINTERVVEKLEPEVREKVKTIQQKKKAKSGKAEKKSKSKVLAEEVEAVGKPFDMTYEEKSNEEQQKMAYDLIKNNPDAARKAIETGIPYPGILLNILHGVYFEIAEQEGDTAKMEWLLSYDKDLSVTTGQELQARKAFRNGTLEILKAVNNLLIGKNLKKQGSGGTTQEQANKQVNTAVKNFEKKNGMTKEELNSTLDELECK